MKDPCADYLKQVRRHLSCPGWEKKRLLAGLKLEIADAFPDGASDLSAVVTRFGPPLAVVQELEAVLPPERLEQYAERKRLLTRAALIGTAMIAVAAIGFIGYLVLTGAFDTYYIITEITEY